MKKFIIAVNSGINFNFAYIKIDDFKEKDNDFYLALIKNAFPDRDSVNRMLAGYRKASMNTLYSAPDIQSIITKKNNNPDILCVLVFDASNEWSLMNG